MDENAVVNLLAIETAVPKRRIVRSVGAVYLALIVLMIGCISIGNLLYANRQIPRHVTQPILYAVIAISGAFLYRWHFLCFRYTLTDEQFAIEQIGGSREKTIAVMMISEIHGIVKQTERDNVHGKKVDASVLPSKNTIWICATLGGTEMAYRISASDAFLERLMQQMLKLKDLKSDINGQSGSNAAQKER
ncbi:MAG TPA: hypothetical protein PKA81_03595 [Clostridia bacterium]|nr:hypothetical protein [Clostridia bacterium]